MPKMDTHAPQFEHSNPHQHPFLTSRGGLDKQLGRKAINSCLSPIKVMQAQTTKCKAKPVLLSDFTNENPRDLLLQKTTDRYDNVQLENGKEFRQLELRKL